MRKEILGVGRKFILHLLAMVIVGVKVLILGGNIEWGGIILGILGAYGTANIIDKKKNGTNSSQS